MALIRVTDRDGVEHEVEGNIGFTLMENLRDLDYGVAAVCGGMCACATCHVYVDPEWLASCHPSIPTRRTCCATCRPTATTRGCPARSSSPSSWPVCKIRIADDE